MVLRRKKKNAIVPHDQTTPGVKDEALVSLLVADIVMRTGSSLLRSFVEKRILKARYDKNVAQQIMQQRSPGLKLASVAATKVATGSAPGAAIVTAGLVAGALYKRGRARKAARKIAGQLADHTED